MSHRMIPAICTALAVTVTFSTNARAQDACHADLDGSGDVSGPDLALLLGAWGPCNGCLADLDGSGAVDAADLATILGFWGSPCVQLPWATVLEASPDPAVVTSAALRDAIVATGYPWRVRDNASQIEMLLIPQGSFDMGCSASDDYNCMSWENPVHAVTLTQPFYVGRYEVTQAEWTSTMGSNPSWWTAAHGYPGPDTRPVEMVSWNMIQGFLSATGLRLLTEAEWEYAYRAGTTTAFHSGPGFPNGTNDDSLVATIAWYYMGPCPPTGQCQTHAVGGKAPNGFGLHDMSGNVAEWVSDWYSPTYFASSPSSDPTGPESGTYRSVRGGSWFDYTQSQRSSDRGSVLPATKYSILGFRVARTP